MTVPKLIELLQQWQGNPAIASVRIEFGDGSIYHHPANDNLRQNSPKGAPDRTSKLRKIGPAILLFLSLASSPIAFGQSVSVAPKLKWQPVIENTSVDVDEVFPAEILAVAGRHVQQKTPPRYLGDPNSALGIVLVSSMADVSVHVSIKVDRLAEESGFDATIPEANQPYEIWPTIRFDTRTLARIRESFPTTALFSVSVNGVTAGEQSRTIQVRSVNDVPFAYVTKDRRVLDVSPLFAAFVDENNPYIDRILHEALRVNVVQRFMGYQGSPQDVIREVFAIWNVMQRQGVKYSSITTPSGESRSAMSQHVRFLDEAVQNSQANCADGSVLFASILYKLGIYPVLVKVPGHMFLGFYTDSQRQQISFLETTMLGEPGLNNVQRNWTFKTVEGYLSSESYRQFVNALNEGQAKFQQAAPRFQAKTPGYLLIDIQAARRAGISAIARF